MPTNELKIPFPFSGVTTDRGYQISDPQTARAALNIVPDDSSEARTRGGSRPGLTKRYQSNVLAMPSYLVRVSVGTNTRVPEVLVVGTPDNVYIGQSIPSGTTVPITYSETLAPLSGTLCTEAGEPLITEDANSPPNEEIIIDEFQFDSVQRCTVIAYKGQVILGPGDVSIGNGSTGSITASGDESTLTDINWTTLGIDLEKHWIEITGTDADLESGTYKIKSFTAGSLIVDGNVFGTSGNPGPVTVSWNIRVGVRVLDPVAATVELLTPTGGIVPTGADAIAVYRDRIVWGVGREWIMSRQGDPGDYDVGADPEDPARAISGTASDAGQPSDPITALAVAGYDYLVIWAEQSTWIMRGDPGFGGQLYNLSPTYGCVACKAWCEGDTTELYFLGKEGLYRMPPNAGEPQALSPDKLPRELQGIDRDNNYVTLAYDPQDHGVLIFVVPRDGMAGTHYWFDINTNSFWPIKFGQSSHQPIDALTFAGSPLQPRRVTIGSIDGFIRNWFGTDDDGTAITSNVVLGPYPTSDMRELDGIVTEYVQSSDEQGGDVTLELYFGRTPEEAVDKAVQALFPDFTATARAGRTNFFKPRRRGRAFCVRLVSTNTWAFEGAFAKLTVAGKVRR